jgi:hypothetical protein
LRSKVDRDFQQKMIQTNRGIGYTFTCGGAPPTSTNGHGKRPPQSHIDPLFSQIRRA